MRRWGKNCLSSFFCRLTQDKKDQENHLFSLPFFLFLFSWYMYIVHGVWFRTSHFTLKAAPLRRTRPNPKPDETQTRIRIRIRIRNRHTTGMPIHIDRLATWDLLCTIVRYSQSVNPYDLPDRPCTNNNAISPWWVSVFSVVQRPVLHVVPGM